MKDPRSFSHLWLLVLLFLPGCCSNYCAACLGCELIEIKIIDRQTRENLTPALDPDLLSVEGRRNFQPLSFHNGDESIFIDVSTAHRDRMDEVFTLLYQGDTLEVIRSSYEINADPDCCEWRNVKLADLEVDGDSELLWEWGAPAGHALEGEVRVVIKW